jgi:8-oxo-dGTP pyrophosphatase MutT (NUDIX family)
MGGIFEWRHWEPLKSLGCQAFTGSRPLRLLTTGCGNGQWGIPKGTIEPGELSFAAAEREAFEEAGIRGHCDEVPIGSFHYFKPGRITPHEVHVHMLRVDLLRDNFPVKGERSLDWVPLHRTSGFVARQGLAKVLRNLSQGKDHHLHFSRLPMYQI